MPELRKPDQMLRVQIPPKLVEYRRVDRQPTYPASGDMGPENRFIEWWHDVSLAFLAGKLPIGASIVSPRQSHPKTLLRARIFKD